MPLPDDQLAQRARALEWLLLDVDGVLTDGRLTYGPGGEEWKVFHVRDGLGLKLLQKAGVKVGILTGRGNAALETRARELGVDVLIQERSDKGMAFTEFLVAQGTSPDRVAAIGDDIQDLPILRRCALSFAPADAMADVRERVDRVLTLRGGEGVVRELCEILLEARGDWERLTAPMLGEP
ncbi:MAG TPA: HAD hydrolase family protein [Thermoanaerobaculia bacterium]|nr:HAD hydrolase family protein [Thermoanaerobaculia bacterium]